MPDRLRIGVGLAGFATFINLYPTQALLPTLADAYGSNLAHTGLTVTASLVAVAMVAPFVGSISDAFGRRRLILAAAFALVLPTLGLAVAPTLPVFIGLRFIQGLLLPFIFAITVAYIAEECPAAEGVRATGSYAVGTIFGGFGGRFIAGWTTQLVGWREAFAVLALLTLAAATAVTILLPPERNFRPVRAGLGGFGQHLRNPQVTATCAVGFAVLFSIVATFTFANFLLAAPPYHLGPAQLGSIFVTYLVGAVVTPIANGLVLRTGRRMTMWFAGGTCIAGLLLTLLPSVWAIVAGMSTLALGVFVEQTLSIGYVALAAKQARSTAVGLYVTTYYVGGALGGILPAGIWAHFGWPGCVALVLLVQAAALTVTTLVWPRRTLATAPAGVNLPKPDPT